MYLDLFIASPTAKIKWNKKLDINSTYNYPNSITMITEYVIEWVNLGK